MWSVWPDRESLYLGTGLAMLQLPGKALLQLEFPATLPLADVLAQLDDKAKRLSPSRPWRTEVYLSAALCQPVAFAVPDGIKKWAELEAVAQSHATRVWDLHPSEASEVVCVIDARRIGLAASMLRGTQQQLIAWSERFGGRQHSLAPLWALATQAPVCRASAVQCVSLSEPDVLTGLDFSNPMRAQAVTWLGDPHPQVRVEQLVAEWREPFRTQNTNVHDTAPHLPKPRSVHLRFGPQASAGSGNANGVPKRWATHWQVTT